MPPQTINDITNAIQLALAPVFLLTGIAGMLNVMSGRLSRIIDRGRTITEGPNALAFGNREGMIDELKMLEKRRHVTSRAITMCTISALFVCLVIVTLFIEVMLKTPFNWIVGILFTLATLALVAGLSFFLREVHMASNAIKIKIPEK
jgi:hypothetical protein